MKNKQLAEELQQSLISLTTSLNVLYSLAQQIETRFKELEDKEVEAEKSEEKMKVLGAREKEVLENEERSASKATELQLKQRQLEEKERIWKKLEEKVGATMKELEERERKVKENEERAKATIRECNAKQRQWGETEKQMEINASKVKQLVNLNIGTLFLYIVLLIFYSNLFFHNRRRAFLHF